MNASQGADGTTQRLPVVLEKEQEPPQGGPVPEGDGRRFWSARKAPATAVALAVLAVAGAFLYDVAAVRAHHRALAWRRDLARQLAERPLDDTWVLTGAAVAAVLGLLLLGLAVTPGHRDVLPMRRTHPDVRAGLHRAAAALVLRDRAMEVAGVQSVDVRLGRRKADVRALSHFRDLDDVRGDLDTTLGAALEGLGLAHPPALSIHVRRPARGKG